MKKEIFNIISWEIVASFLIVQIGCSSFPPPHANSFYTQDEVVTVRTLTCDGLREYKEDWEASFKSLDISFPCPVEPKKIAPVAPLVIGIVAPLAFGYVKDKLKQETTNYVQQFGTTYFDAFWQGRDGKYSPKFYGFEITRNAKRYDDEGSEQGKEVFKLVYGLAEDKDGFFWLSPVYFTTSRTKAKVAAWGGPHTIDTKVELALDAVWVEGRQRYHKENIAKFDPLTIKGYEIDSPKVLRTSCNTKEDTTCLLLEGGLNSFAGIPISVDSSSPEAGRFWLTVLVTESDTAKTKKYITDLSEVLDKNRDKIINFIKKAND